MSRLNPIYLAGRHAGVTFMLLAAGLAVGVAVRGLAQPVRYSAEAAAAATASGPGLDWEGKGRDWRTALADGRAGAALTNNLRHAVKLAVTTEQDVDASRLAGELILLKNGSTFPASLLSGLPARIGPSITVRTEEIAENLDAQSLAVIAADLDPPPGGAGGEWDFSFFRPVAGGVPVLARPGPDEHYFRVFYRIHRLLNGGSEPAGPDEARRSAVAEVASRLERESQFPGGGGFGAAARQELMREIQCIPVLAANGLYGAGWGSGGGEDEDEDNSAPFWPGRWAGAEVSLRGSETDGTATASVGFDLYPLMSPRDTAATRVQSLAATVILAYFAALEAPAATAAAAAASRPAAPTQPASPTPAALSAPAAVQVLAVEPALAAATAEAAEEDVPAAPQTRTVVREEPDAEAAAELQGKIRALEENMLSGEAQRPALERRFAVAREDVARLSSEATAARARADRFRERYDAAARTDRAAETAVPAADGRLLAERDGLAKRLAALLLYCTEEHPFVVEARRSISAIDVLLETGDPARTAERDAEARAGRLANLYLEWETASASADGLDERLRRRGLDVDAVQAELTELEGRLLRDTAEAARLRAEPMPMRRVEVQVAVEAPAPAPAPVAVKPASLAPAAAAATPAPAMAAAPALALPTLALALPTYVPLHRSPPGLAAVWAGLLAGVLASVGAMIFRELWGKRFYRAGEAERLVGIPLLAALPAYDGKSMRAAAKTVKGEVVASKGGLLTFSPPPVDFSEPPPAAKRGKIRPAGRRLRAGTWAVGVVLIALAGWLFQRGAAGLFQPGLRELSAPVFVPEPPAEDRP